MNYAHGKLIEDLRWCRENYERARTMPAIDAAIELLSAQTPPRAKSGLSDGAIREIVNQLRDIAIEFHQTQQLRARIASVIVPRLKAVASPLPTHAPDGEPLVYLGGGMKPDPSFEGGEGPVTDAMVYAFHRSMSDGALGVADFNELREGLRAALLAAPQPAPATGDEREAHGEAEVSTVAEVMAECESFEAAMVEAGFSRPALGRHIGMYRYRRDGDRFTGWKLASAAHRQEDQRDAGRLDWLAARQAWVAWGKDGESCRVFRHDEDGDTMPIMGWKSPWFSSPREAIDAAMQRTAAPAHGEPGALEQGDAL